MSCSLYEAADHASANPWYLQRVSGSSCYSWTPRLQIPPRGAVKYPFWHLIAGMGFQGP